MHTNWFGEASFGLEKDKGSWWYIWCCIGKLVECWLTYSIYTYIYIYISTNWNDHYILNDIKITSWMVGWFCIHFHCLVMSTWKSGWWGGFVPIFNASLYQHDNLDGGVVILYNLEQIIFNCIRHFTRY